MATVRETGKLHNNILKYRALLKIRSYEQRQIKDNRLNVLDFSPAKQGQSFYHQHPFTLFFRAFLHRALI
mgnify:CR=1 FL=1